MAEEQIGTINDYFARIGVAAIELTGTLRVGDTIRIRGHTTDIEQVVDSLQIEHGNVEAAQAGQSVGIKVKDRCRRGDQVYRLVAD